MDLARAFLVSRLEGRAVEYETIHPWRRRWEFIVMHSYRVEDYARRIFEKEGVGGNDMLLTRVAAILHDLGRIQGRDGHARAGREIVEAWMGSGTGLSCDEAERRRILHMIEAHTDKSAPESDFCLAVLKDADVLDEIGMMSIFMASDRIDRDDPFFFHNLLERMERHEAAFCEEKAASLNTRAAKAIMHEKARFMDMAALQLRSELRGTETLREELQGRRR